MTPPEPSALERARVHVKKLARTKRGYTAAFAQMTDEELTEWARTRTEFPELINALTTRLTTTRTRLEQAERRCEWAAAGLHGDPLFGDGATEPLYVSAMNLRSQLATAEAKVERQLDADAVRFVAIQEPFSVTMLRDRGHSILEVTAHSRGEIMRFVDTLRTGVVELTRLREMIKQAPTVAHVLRVTLTDKDLTLVAQINAPSATQLATDATYQGEWVECIARPTLDRTGAST